MIVAIVCRRLHAPSGDARLQHFLKLVKTGKVSGVTPSKRAIEGTLAANGLETVRPRACGRQRTGLYRSS